MVLSKQPVCSDGHDTPDNKERPVNNNLIAVLPEMSEIQGDKMSIISHF